MAVSKTHRRYSTSLRRNDGAWEHVSYCLHNRATFLNRVQTIVMGRDYYTALDMVEDLRQRIRVQKLVLDNIYHPIKKQLLEYGEAWLTKDPICKCAPNRRSTKYSFGSVEKNDCSFRYIEEKLYAGGFVKRHVTIDVRFATESDYEDIVKEIVERHKQCKSAKCHGVLGSDEIDLCEMYISDMNKQLDSIENDLKAHAPNPCNIS